MTKNMYTPLVTLSATYIVHWTVKCKLFVSGQGTGRGTGAFFITINITLSIGFWGTLVR